MCQKCEEALSKVTEEDRNELLSKIELVVTGWKKEFQATYPEGPAFLMCCCLNMILWQGGKFTNIEQYILEQLTIEASRTVLLKKYRDPERIH